MEDADAEFGGMDNMALYVDAWDAGCPWRPWAVQSDPVGVPSWTFEITSFAPLIHSGSCVLAASAADPWHVRSSNTWQDQTRPRAGRLQELPPESPALVNCGIL